jgi:hypothetical protein
MKNYIVEYMETGDLYLVLGETKFKHPESRQWISAILYKPLYGDMGLTYVREISDFTEKFKTWSGDVAVRKIYNE